MNPRYPIYIPSKGRSDKCLTAQFLEFEKVPFRLVVEPSEKEKYSSRFGDERLLILPWDGDNVKRKEFASLRKIENGGLVCARNWIKEHSIKEGYKRHWQLDDNILGMWRRYRGKKLPCESVGAFLAIEDFSDRYENIAVAGMNYYMFAPNNQDLPPFVTNCHVYSSCLFLNSFPNGWRIARNDDTDFCLQALSAGFCTVLFNVFLAWKMKTMTVKGGNTADLYQGDGRLKMARSLERLWPGVVETKRRFKRPQHVIKYAWRRFDTPLKLKPEFVGKKWEPNEYGMTLKQVKPIRSKAIKELLKQSQAG